MTRFTVVWDPAIENQLAELWMQRPDRNAISHAANLIDLELSTDAADKGHLVGDKLRVLVVAPLDVLFEVSPDDRMVRIVDLHYDDPARYERN